MGGGTILILILSLFLGVEQHIAQATNIVFFIPTSISAIIVNSQNKNIEWETAKIIIIFGVIGAIIGARISTFLPAGNLRIFFGIFLAIITLYEIYNLIKEYILKRKRNNKIKKEQGGFIK